MIHRVAPKHYRLTRNFAICALIVVVLAAVGLAFVNRSFATAQLQRTADRNNAALTQTLANLIWPEARVFIRNAQGLSAKEIRAHPWTAELTKAVTKIMAETNVLKVQLYDLQGLTLFSTAPEQIGADNRENPRFQGAIAGEPAAKLEFREQFGAMDGAREDLWVLSSYIPVRPAGQGSAIEGVVEIHSDVTDIHAYVRQNEFTLMAVGGLSFVLVFFLLLAIVWYADRQIRRYHQLNLELTANYTRADAASKEKLEFLANISHELRTPLTAIIGFSEMIKDAVYGPLGSKKYLEFGRDIHASGRHMLEIIIDVLDLLNAESGEMAVTYSRVDVATLVREVVVLLAPKAKRAEVRLAAEIGSGPVKIETDEAKVRQILINLTANAIDFTPSGGTVSIALHERRRSDQIVLVVSDTGVGIKREDLPKAHLPFTQIDESLARKREGTGLGLPLSKTLAEFLGGSLDVDSRHGIGTRVTVVLPSRLAQEPKPGIRSAA